MTTCVIGLGYIGTPLSVLMAENNMDVIGVDKDPDVVRRFNHGITNSCEKDVAQRLKRLIEVNRISAVEDLPSCQNYIVAVPTPLGANKNPDLSALNNAIDRILDVIMPGQLIVIESTVPVGTVNKIAEKIKKHHPDLADSTGNLKVNIAYCPERILPGNTMFELENNERIIGGLTGSCSRVANRVYSKFLNSPIHLTDAKTAEFVKLAENSFRDVNIAYANELSMIADEMEVDAYKAIALANRHPRVSILNPGPGVGGHCIAVDPWFLINGIQNSVSVIRSAREINDQKPDFVLYKIRSAIKDLKVDCKDLSVSILGITYKANSSDIRESPSLYIARQVHNLGFKNIIIVEPNLASLPKPLEADTIRLTNHVKESYATDLIILLVKHKEFNSLSFDLKSSASNPLFLSFA